MMMVLEIRQVENLPHVSETKHRLLPSRTMIVVLNTNDYFATGDHDLLDVRSSLSILVMTVAEFAKLFNIA